VTQAGDQGGYATLKVAVLLSGWIAERASFPTFSNRPQNRCA
jgi:hypothetical protein